MSGARPIPISNSRRSSPPGSTGSGRDLSMDAISHSLPAPVLTPGGGCAFPTSSAASAAAARYHPPRAPFFGSLPEPSFLQMDDDAMPELMLPPRLNERDESPPAASVVQFASSCPVDIGFLRPNHMMQRSWAPSPRALDEFDLSRSPALAVMSAVRDGRPPTNQPFQRRAMGSSNREFFREPSSSVQTNAERMASLSLSEPGGPSFQRQPSVDRRDRRGSYGNLSDLDEGEVFDFEDQ